MNFSLLLLVIASGLLRFIFRISSLVLFFITISIVIVIAVAIVGRAITLSEAIKKICLEPTYKTDKRLCKEVNSDNFSYCKYLLRCLYGGAIEKSQILLSQYWKNYRFDSTIIILYLGAPIIFSSNIIFVIFAKTLVLFLFWQIYLHTILERLMFIAKIHILERSKKSLSYRFYPDYLTYPTKMCIKYASYLHQKSANCAH